MNLFETASREKYRFPYKGQITAEDLWDLSLTQLDTVYRELSKSNQAVNTDSLLTTTTTDTKTTNMIEIVRHIFNAKKSEAEARKQALEDKKKKERIAEVLAQKEDEALHTLSVDELKKLLGSMG